MPDLGKYLIITGVILLLLGIIFSFFPRISNIPKLTGDLVIKKENFTLYVPIVTSILISIILTLLFWLISYFTKK